MRLPVLVIDDHRVFADTLGLSLNLQPDLHCIGTAYTARDGLSLAAETPYAVAVVDLRLPDASGLEVVTELRDLRPTARTVVLTAHAKADLAERALASGVAAFLSKDAALAEVLAAIRSADPDRPVVTGLEKPPDLTHRELDVLRQLAQGHDARRAAAALGLSVHTVRSYIKTLLAKLGAQTQLDAVVAAERRGLITVGSRY